MVQSDACAQPRHCSASHRDIFSCMGDGVIWLPEWELHLLGFYGKETEQMGEGDEMKSSTFNGANLCQKKEGDIHPSS